MGQPKSLRHKFSTFIAVLIPLLITQVGLFAMNFIDTIMIGRVGAADLAGAAIGSSIWVVLDAIDGILLSTMPLVSQLVGAKKYNEVPNVVFQALYIAVAAAILIIAAGAFALNPFLDMMNLDPVVAEKARYYLISLAFGLFPLHIFIVLFYFMSALGRTMYAMVLMLLSLPLNILLNYVFIFGKFGFPKLGVVGAGISTAAAYWVLMILSIYVVHRIKPFSTYRLFSKVLPFSSKEIKVIIVLGLPIGLSMMVDTGIDTVITLLMGAAFDTYTLAAHQVIVNLRVLLYMVPLSISMAATSVIGFSIGAKKYKDATDYLKLSFLISMVFICVIVPCLYFFNEWAVRLYTNDETIIPLAKTFMLFALAVIILESMKMPIQGALRGAKDVRWSLGIDFAGYWIFALSAGIYFTYQTRLKEYGYWAGLAVGLILIVSGQAIRWFVVQRKLRGSDRGMAGGLYKGKEDYL